LAKAGSAPSVPFKIGSDLVKQTHHGAYGVMVTLEFIQICMFAFWFILE